MTDETPNYLEIISANRFHVLSSTEGLNTVTWGREVQKTSGKVRDIYDCGRVLVIITTDRQSAFDRNLAEVPYKGQVLNLLSLWWFQQSSPLVPNAILASPHPNVTIARKCTVFPVEFVVRAYITGSTATSMWTNYRNGVRHYCGHELLEGMRKNQKLEHVIITPTTKSDEHDALISADEIVAQGWMTQEQWDICAGHAITLFPLGQAICAEKGFILVDTKYEFGVDEVGLIRVVDEVHTPDSSRFWKADTYAERFASGEEPESVDKEILRRWYVGQCDPYDSTVALPQAPTSLVSELSLRYINVYEAITEQRIDFGVSIDLQDIGAAVKDYFDQHT